MRKGKCDINKKTWFTTKSEDLGIAYQSESNTPYAVVMDIGLGTGTVTIFISNLGDGSMYTSSGGGILGGIPRGIEDENARKASINFVMIAGGFIDKMALDAAFPLPLKNKVKLYLLTPTVVYTTEEVDANLLTASNHELSPMFLAGNDVITALKLVSSQ